MKFLKQQFSLTVSTLFMVYPFIILIHFIRSFFIFFLCFISFGYVELQDLTFILGKIDVNFGIVYRD